jgi:hypothetical protein
VFNPLVSKGTTIVAFVSVVGLLPGFALAYVGLVYQVSKEFGPSSKSSEMDEIGS